MAPVFGAWRWFNFTLLYKQNGMGRLALPMKINNALARLRPRSQHEYRQLPLFGGIANALLEGPYAAASLVLVAALFRFVLSRERADALGAIGSAGSSAAIAPYVRHRRAEVRGAAALALARTRGPEAATALRLGLRSSDAALRALSATGLGAAGDEDSVPDLAKALDRGVVEAAPSIGALCVGAQCDDLLARLDKVAPDTARAVLEAMLARKPALPDDVLARAVSKVNPAVGTSAKTYFSSLAKAFKGSKKVQRALDAAAHPPRETKP